jgi:hypothetical protein
MALKPNYSFERRERERLQALKAEEKARLKRESRRGADETADPKETPPTDLP